MTQPTPPPVTDDDLWAVPLEHRRTVARWLTQRAASFEASSLFGPFLTETVKAAVQGAAVDLMTPGVETPPSATHGPS
jgi:hypothetical protein